MLIDDIVDYCNKKYTTFGDKCGNGVCSHPTGKCSGSCYNCLCINFIYNFRLSA